jgi:hypothetical protein
LRPATNCGWIGQARRILAVRCGLFQRFAGTDALARLLPTTQRVGRRRRQPVGQDREGLPARSTQTASHPDASAPVIMGGSKSPSVPDDRVLSTQRAVPRQAAQRNYPGSRLLSFTSGSAIKRIKAGVKASLADSSCQRFVCKPEPSPSGQVSVERKEYRFALLPANPFPITLAGLKPVIVRDPSPDRPLKEKRMIAGQRAALSWLPITPDNGLSPKLQALASGWSIETVDRIRR